MSYKFIITIDCQRGTRSRILDRAPAAQAEPGCIAYDFYTCTDDPDRLVFVETWADEAGHGFHMEQQRTKDFIAFHEPFHRNFTFETINVS